MIKGRRGRGCTGASATGGLTAASAMRGAAAAGRGQGRGGEMAV
ncbi:hypothetical protein [Sphingomonas sp.]